MMAELKLAIKKLPSKKAPGEDGIFNQFLKHFDKPLRQEILTLSNLIWTTGEIPSSFTRSLICPIFKQGTKPSEECCSYRPIALTSCLSKLIERLVMTHLMYRLEHDGTISHFQSAYRRGRSTLDPLMRLISDVHLGFETKPFL